METKFWKYVPADQANDYDVWFLCSECSRGFLNFESLALHKLKSHGIVCGGRRKSAQIEKVPERRRKSCFAKRSEPFPVAREKAIGTDIESLESIKTKIKVAESILRGKKRRPPSVQFVAPRKTARSYCKRRNLYGNSESLLRKVLTNNWMKSISPMLKGRILPKETSQDSNNNNNNDVEEPPPMDVDVAKIIFSDPSNYPKKKNSLEDVEYLTLKEKGMRLNSIIKRQLSPLAAASACSLCCCS